MNVSHISLAKCQTMFKHLKCMTSFNPGNMCDYMNYTSLSVFIIPISQISKLHRSKDPVQDYTTGVRIHP